MPEQKLQYVISDERPISCAGGWKAHDMDGQPLGIFPNENDAAKAVYRQANAAPVVEGG